MITVICRDYCRCGITDPFNVPAFQTYIYNYNSNSPFAEPAVLVVNSEDIRTATDYNIITWSLI